MIGIILSQGISQTSHRHDAKEDNISMHEGSSLLQTYRKSGFVTEIWNVCLKSEMVVGKTPVATTGVIPFFTSGMRILEETGWLFTTKLAQSKFSQIEPASVHKILNNVPGDGLLLKPPWTSSLKDCILSFPWSSLPVALQKAAHLLQRKEHSKMNISVWRETTSEPAQPVVCSGSKPWPPREEKSDLSSGASCVLGAGTWEFCALWEGESWFSQYRSLGANQHVSGMDDQGPRSETGSKPQW